MATLDVGLGGPPRSMAVLIDASVLIAYERGALDAERRVTGREDEAFLLSVITASELLHGVHRAGTRRGGPAVPLSWRGSSTDFPCSG